MTGTVFKILLICLVGFFFGLTLKKYHPEYTFLLGLGIGVWILFTILPLLSQTIEEITNYSYQMENAGYYMKIALKSLGLSLVTEIVADTCRDGGQTALASKTEFAGKVGILLLCIPLFKECFEAAVSIIS